MNSKIRRSRFNPLNELLALVWVLQGCVACSAISPTSNHIPAASVLEAIRKQEAIHLENKTIDGDLDFTTLPAHPETETLQRVSFDVPLFFKHCVFTGKVLGFSQKNAQTTVCTFRKNLSFLACIFNEDVIMQSISVTEIGCFSWSQFNRLVSFAGASFLSEAYFDNLLVAQEAHLQRVRFLKLASFWKTVWAGTVYFQGTVFADDAQFNLTDFRANLDFSLCTTGLLNFNYAKLTGRSSFADCHFRNAVDFSNATLREISFKGAWFDAKAAFTTISSERFSVEDTFFLTQKPVINFRPPQPAIVNQQRARVVITTSLNSMDN